MILIFSVIIISLITKNYKLVNYIAIEQEKNQRINIELNSAKTNNEQLKSNITELENQILNFEKELIELKKSKRVINSTTPTRNGSRIFKASAYDLSYASCGKEPSHPSYGITASGFSLKGKTLKDKYIAVDKNIIPLGSEVHIEFFEPYTHLTGNYTAVDTGGAIKGNRVDIFFGSGNVNAAAMAFGRRDVRVTY